MTLARLPGLDADGKPSVRLIYTQSNASAYVMKKATMIEGSRNAS